MSSFESGSAFFGPGVNAAACAARHVEPVIGSTKQKAEATMNRQPEVRGQRSEVRGQRSEVRGREEMNNRKFFRLWRSICNPFAMGGSARGAQSAMLCALLAVGMLAGNAYADTYLATGGDRTTNYTDGGMTYAAHIFTNTAAGPFYFTPSANLTVDYLIVAGGGAGGGYLNGGGGGAGAVLEGTGLSLEAETPMQVTVGVRGNGGVGRGGTGGTSAFGLLTVPGGGGGGKANTTDGPGANGGCGGGGAYVRAGGDTTAVSPQQGTAGGAGAPTVGNPLSNRTGGGGGGAGGPGGDGASAVKGVGGLGVTRSITGEEMTYATGGTGGQRAGSPGQPAAQPANTGNGGTGASKASPPGVDGGHGGSGIVVIRYRTPPQGALILLR